MTAMCVRHLAYAQYPFNDTTRYDGGSIALGKKSLGMGPELHLVNLTRLGEPVRQRMKLRIEDR